ncbi:hypothetical protein SAMN05216167_104217 [Spirosoma endophyticum]|uniref:Uncharacterized protein n=1 Tax=Spirosoma endophyticum TaxID=662367 RepID=A0A1I1RDR0_9BACT|nr:hypothetical protein SAMN05216167_104217 [Spirosoma endophyticum]
MKHLYQVYAVLISIDALRVPLSLACDFPYLVKTKRGSPLLTESLLTQSSNQYLLRLFFMT